MFFPGAHGARRPGARANQGPAAAANQATIHAGDGTGAIEAVLKENGSGFVGAYLDLPWTYGVGAVAVNWGQRLSIGIHYWLTCRLIRPSSAVIDHDSLKGRNKFVRTEKSFKTAIAVMTIWRSLFGSTKPFPKTKKGGLLLSLNADSTFFESYVSPLVRIYVSRFNAALPDGQLMLNYSDLLNFNYRQFRVNFVNRGRLAGSWSNAEALRIVSDEAHLAHNDNNPCAGIFHPWYRLLCSWLPNFCEETERGMGHYITDAEHSAIDWEALRNAVPPF